MKITDEIVAKALGYEKQPKTSDPRRKYLSGQWLNPCKKKHYATYNLPPFTTSLDAIVAEIKGDWKVESEITSRGNFTAEIFDEYSDGVSGYGETAPLALCAALLAFIKETK